MNNMKRKNLFLIVLLVSVICKSRARTYSSVSELEEYKIINEPSFNEDLRSDFMIKERNSAAHRNDNAIIPPCDCGQVVESQNRIFRGRDANPQHRYPWLVYITFNKNGGRAICTGVIIHEKFILSAAHCFLEGNTPQEDLVDVSSVIVHVGDFSRSKSDDIENVTQVVNVDEIIVHEEANLSKIKNDIALLRLSRPLDLKSHDEVKPICLPTYSSDDLNGFMEAAGWGKLKPKGRVSRNLQEAIVFVTQECYFPYRDIDPSYLCVSGIFQNSFLCEGDSGGPIMRIKNGRYEVVGVVSALIGKKESCPTSHGFSLLTNVAYYYDWISDHVKFDCI